MRIPIVLLAFLAAVATAKNPREEFKSGKIVGGSVTTISQYPHGVALLLSTTQTNYRQACGAAILNQRSVLTAAHCFWETGMIASRWRARVGSSWANSGGTVHFSSQIINHPQYNPNTQHNDVSVLRLSSNIQYIPNAVQACTIAGPNYNVADNAVVWAIGWGTQWQGGPSSEQLRHVQIWTVNLAICRQRYAQRGYTVTDNMLCSGWLDVGGRDQCQGDSGGPLYHNGVVVGVCSWGYGCADSHLPGVNARVSSLSSWISSNA